MVAVFREVRRVLRPDGTLWLNIGDSYATPGSGAGPAIASVTRQKTRDGTGTRQRRRSWLQAQDLLMMPARLALALQADGWWVRSDIIWHKPNPMPESVTDRPTSAHEHVFLLTCSPRYFYDAEAVREEAMGSYVGQSRILRRPGHETDDRRARWQVYEIRAIGSSCAVGSAAAEYGVGRNLRNVWTIATHAFSAAHFATYPPELVERCIRAGTSERGCCAACGAPWRRTTDTSYERNRHGHSGRTDASGSNGWDGGAYPNLRKISTTTGWAASCSCSADVVPATVLDPFAGASTTLLVAQRLQRRAIGIELNPEYVTMGRQRIEDEAGLFADVQTLGGVPSDVAEPQPTPGFAQPDLFAEAAD